MEEESYFDRLERRREMLPETDTDITGVVLSPGRPDICKGNGKSHDDDGDIIHCCDNCDYYIVCFTDELKKHYGYLFGVGKEDDPNDL